MIRNCWIALYDRNGVIIDMHPPAAGNWQVSELIGNPVADYIRAVDREKWTVAFQAVLTQNISVIWDGLDLESVAWRAWLFPMRRPPKVAAAAIVRQWPERVRKLTAGERRICCQIALGKSGKQIAKAVGITLGAVHNRRSQIARKLGLHPSALAGWAGLHEEWLS
jgi:DNA-binding CsgD family transcriptional regulator